MKINLLLLVLLALAFSFFPVRQAQATTYSEASSNCDAHVSWALAHQNPNWAYLPTSCELVVSQKSYEMQSTNGYGLINCGSFGEPSTLGSCVYTGSDPPNCVKGIMQPPAHSWVDGTDCDSGGCMLGLILGGAANGETFENGKVCPYDPNANPLPPDQPPAAASTTPPPPSAPECNADGSCKICIGNICATVGGPDAPPPPSASSSGDPHSTDSGTTYNYGYGYPGSGSTAGAPGSGSSSGGTGTGSGDTGTGGPPTSADTKCTTGVCDVGDADGAMGGMYQHSDQTIAGVFGGYINSIKAAPIMATAGAFFAVQAGGSCPSWHIPGNQYWGPAGFDFSFFCSSAMLALFQFAGWLVLAAGAFCAFRIALY